MDIPLGRKNKWKYYISELADSVKRINSPLLMYAWNVAYRNVKSTALRNLETNKET